MNKEPITFQWDETNPSSRYGDGISHPKRGAKTKLYRLLVRGPEMAAMKVQLPAETQRAAIAYGKARWPNAAIEVIK